MALLSVADGRLDSVLAAAKAALRRDRSSIALVFALGVLAHGYLFATYIFTNHTLANVTPQPWPSYRSWEGRWVADLIYLLQGGAGIPLLQQCMASLIQVGNGIAFARMTGAKAPAEIVLGASLVTLHPFILDYYGYAGDHLPFVIGDALILGALALAQRGWGGLLAAVLLVSAALGIYQAKIALLATVALLLCLVWLLSIAAGEMNWREGLRRARALALAATLGCVVYLVQLRLMTSLMPGPETQHFALRLQTNGVAEAIAMVPLIFGNMRLRLFAEYAVYGRQFAGLPGLVGALFLLRCGYVLARSKARSRLGLALLLAALVLLVPLAIYAAFLVSQNSYWHSSRFHVGQAYLLAFMVMLLGRGSAGLPRKLWVACGAALVGWFVILDARTLHGALLDRMQEMAIVERVLARVERDPNYPGATHPLAIFGSTPRTWPALIAPPWRPGFAHVNFIEPAFIFYRQAELLNFLAGREAFSYPSPAQLAEARRHAEAMPAWPAEGSMKILENGTVVVVLAPRRGAEWESVTMTR